MKKIIVCFSLLISGVVLGQNCSQCATKLLENQKINKLSIDELCLLVNEIYARKGYVFKDYRYADYFEKQSWYKPLNQNNQIKFNATEEKNISLLKKIIQEKEARREKIISDFKELKKITQNGDWEALKKFSFKKNVEDGELTEYAKQALKRALHKIDFEDIHFYKKKGLYKIEMDNGEQKEYFSFVISDDTISLYFSITGFSDLITEDKNYPFEYRSEEIEEAYHWEFEFKNNQVQLVRLQIAG